MIGSTRRVRVYAYGAPTDMRRSFDGLFAMVRRDLGRDPLSGDLFLFVGRDRRRAKVLFWDGTGLCLYAKRLETGLFSAPWKSQLDRPLEMTSSELQLFLEGSPLAGKVSLSPPEFAIN
ncbi:MAG: IS66 family insertion sequence element accessory protein TnpB [Candidatus Sericytochromatia bacterium]|nr:IS66 family insertion sequence element accessory protein TnpB [Candidatus Sericytochromatia bacterium]